MKVQMFTHVSGGRGDGSVWPAAGGVIDLDDDEAAQVVAGKLGRYLPEEERAVPPDEAEEQRAPAPKRAAASRAPKPATGAAADD